MACLINGDVFTWIIKVTNSSIIPVTGVEGAVTLPLGVTFASYSATKGTYDDGTSTWSVGSLAPGASATLTIEVSVTTQALQPFTASVVVSGNEFEPYLLNNIASDQKGGACTDGCLGGFNCSDNTVSCTCGQIVLTSGTCNVGSDIEYRVVEDSEVNATVALDISTGHYNVTLLNYALPWSFDYEIYCCCGEVCTGPLTSCTISGESNIDCSTWGFIVNSGLTDDIEDDANGTADVGVCGADVLHFYSSDETVVISVTAGSAIVDLTTPVVGVVPTVAGHLIATVTNELGTAVEIDETVTTLVDNLDGTCTYTNEAGVDVTFTADSSAAIGDLCDCEPVSTEESITIIVFNNDLNSIRLNPTNAVDGGVLDISWGDGTYTLGHTSAANATHIYPDVATTVSRVITVTEATGTASAKIYLQQKADDTFEIGTGRPLLTTGGTSLNARYMNGSLVARRCPTSDVLDYEASIYAGQDVGQSETLTGTLDIEIDNTRIISYPVYNTNSGSNINALNAWPYHNASKKYRATLSLASGEKVLEFEGKLTVDCVLI